MTTSPTSPPPGIVMRDMLTAYWTSASLIAVAKLGIADRLASGPKTPAELASATGTLAEPLFRVLRALASVGVFEEVEGGRFALTPLAEQLRDDVPGSQRAMAILMGDEHYRAWGELEHSLRTGGIAFDHVFGKACFDFLAQHPDKAANFDRAMVSVHGRETSAMCDAYDFSVFGVLYDVGGGNGSLLRTVLDRTPKLLGVVYDLPHVVERARPNLPPRCDVIGGSFFESVPAYDGRAGSGAAVAYLMRHIIHDWDDEKSLTILKNVRKVIPSNGKLLVVEGVVPPGNGRSFTKMLDLNMMLIPGGKERTEAEYRELYAKAGFKLARIVPTASEVSVIEGVPA